jgi:Clr5 domain
MAQSRSSRLATRRSMPERGSGIDLDPHRVLITRLYHIEKKSLKEVMRSISEEFNINVTFVSLQEMVT